MRTALCLVLVAAALPGCRKKAKAPAAAPADAPKPVDVTADRAAAKGSWILAIARDPDVLSKLADTAGDGWRGLFVGDPAAAVEGFDAAARSADAVDARTGLARAALDLADANHSLGLLQVGLTERWLDAVGTRPNAEQTAAWRALIQARLLVRQGKDAAEPLARVGSDPSLAGWVPHLAADAASPLALHLRGQGPAPAEWPAGTSETYQQRLGAWAAARQGDWRESQRRLKGHDPEAADFAIGEGLERIGFRDPLVAGFEAQIWAARALEAVDKLEGWPAYHAARAELLLGRPKAAAQRLERLLAAPPAEAPFAMLALSEFLDRADLLAGVGALRVQALVEAGEKAAAEAAFAKLEGTTVGQRVLRSWAGAVLGKPLDTGIFPEDRDVLAGALRGEVQALGAAAKGQQDLSQLSLVERYVDRVQRRYAATLAMSGQPAAAVKARQAAEDKTAAMAPSPRNTLPALAAAAYDQVGIGQRRVALKYLSRMKEQVPAASGPAEMLRDLLSLKAMEHDGSATAGQ
ncbi:MAG: hypothetical protein KC613_01625 [Myxococcales bacterium]|nr:hypothetical protein [Myxococcales bacterium]MCB9522366.1 hypothetical protein [Myxococcales bacterium]